MKSIRLSERLREVAELVPHGARVIDVGTDHAMVPVWLAQSGRASHIWASDLREGPLESASRLIGETGTEELIELRRTDGLQGFSREDGDTVIIAGMGGETMISILSRAPWISEDVLLILEPQSKQELLRRWLNENGFAITKERLVMDAGRLYPILTARSGQPQQYSEAEYRTGLWSLIGKDPLLPQYLEQLERRNGHAAPYDPAAMSLAEGYREMKERLSAMPKVGEIYDLLAQKAPVENKLSFDNVGLLVGRSDSPVHRILTALDITDEVIREAVDIDAQLIVSHHPLFFELKSVTDGTWTGERALTLAENRIAAICMHTNLDAASGGVNDALLSALGCTYVGELDPETMIGRVGAREKPTELADFLTEAKSSLHCSGLRYHDAGRPVQKVAVCGGSGGGELALAFAAGCDTYVTADIKYDPFLEAKHLGMNLIDADHFCTENVVIPVLAAWIADAFPNVDVRISRVHGQTVQFF